MTRYIVSGYIGFDNFGDEAIAHVLTEKLKAGNADFRRRIVFVQIAPDVDTQDRAVVENKFGDLPIRVRPPIGAHSQT